MNRHKLGLFLVAALLTFITSATLFAGSLPAIKVGSDKAIITNDSFLDVMHKHANSVLWIDTRDRNEVTADGTFSQARVIPVEEMNDAIPNLPNDKPIIFFCSTGARAGEAYDFLMMKRGDVEAYFLEAEIAFKHKAYPEVTAIE